ncbi:hypothetical protein ABK040_006025 [Willaertia magna]
MENSEQAFASGMLEVLEPLAAQYDIKIRDIQLSQTQLSEQIDSLSKQLDQCQQEAQFVDVSPYLVKLTNSRKRVINISTTLGHISDRLARLNKLAKQKYPELELLRQQRIERLKYKQTPTTPTNQSLPTETNVTNTPIQQQTTVQVDQMNNNNTHLLEQQQEKVTEEENNLSQEENVNNSNEQTSTIETTNNDNTNTEETQQ